MPVSKQSLFLDTTIGLLEQGYTVRFSAPGRSMLPTIKDGETITVEPAIAASIKLGDIILYRNRTGVIAHRVMRIEQTGKCDLRFIPRGDAMAVSDPPVDADQVLGRVVSVRRNGRNVRVSGAKAKFYRTARRCASQLKTKIAVQGRNGKPE